MANNIERAEEGINSLQTFGRRDIYTGAEEITRDNVLTEVNAALGVHAWNLEEEELLYWYKRGNQPVLHRTKKRNSFINNKVVENHATEFVSFKKGYFIPQPCYYIARGEESQEKVKVLNEYLYRSGKHDADNEAVDWFYSVGKGAIFVEPNPDDEEPVRACALDPRQAFVVYSIRPGKKPMMGINAVTVGKKLYVDVYTEREIFRLYGGESAQNIFREAPYAHKQIPMVSGIDSIVANPLGEIPIIEYRASSDNMAAFEPAMMLLNAINTIQSNRVDGVEQFIQSLMVIYNADLPEGEDKQSIREQGILLLKSIGDQASDIKILSEQLNQEQTQKLVDNLYEQALRICAMPSTTKGGRSTSDTGTAVLARDGWYQAECAARNTEDEFRRSNRQFDRIFTKILREKGLLDIGEGEFELQFVRNETSNVISKSQALLNLLTAGLEPTLALAKSGISNDPVADYAASEKWLKQKWGDPDAPKAVEGVLTEQTIVAEPTATATDASTRDIEEY